MVIKPQRFSTQCRICKFNLFLLKVLSLSFPQSHYLIARKPLVITQIFCLWLKANIKPKKKKKNRYPFTTTSSLLLHRRRGPHPPCHCHETLWLGMEPPGSTSMTITNTTSINLIRSTMDGLDLLSEFFFPSFSWIRIWLWWIFWVSFKFVFLDLLFLGDN